MEKSIIEDILEKRVNSNRELFTESELKDILINKALYVKVYLLGLIDVRM